MNRGLVILGTGGNCTDILEIVMALPGQPYTCAGFLDDDARTHGRAIGGVRVLGALDSARACGDCLFVNVIGSPTSFLRKREILARTGIPDDRFATIVHPSAVVSPSASLGAGTVVFPNVTIGSGARVGRHGMILANCVISHDCVLGDWSVLASTVSLAGGVTIGESCYLGMASTVRGGVHVGAGSLVGMGSVVIRDVDPGSVVAGNPARTLRRSLPDHQP